MIRSLHFERNISVLKALTHAGADVRKAHSIEHHLYCYSEDSFKSAIVLGGLKGFSVQHEGKQDGEDLWSLDLVKLSVPTIKNIEDQSFEIQEIADATDAEYDGWGTKVEK